MPPRIPHRVFNSLGDRLADPCSSRALSPADADKVRARTYALVVMLGYVSWGFGVWPFVATVLVVLGYQAAD